MLYQNNANFSCKDSLSKMNFLLKNLISLTHSGDNSINSKQYMPCNIFNKNDLGNS